jgi:hypothetical protein
MAQTTRQEIVTFLTSWAGFSSDGIARGIGRPVPAVRRTLAQMTQDGTVTRTGDNYLGYRYFLPVTTAPAVQSQPAATV